MKQKFLLCVNNIGYELSLELHKLYEQIPGKEAASYQQVRIVGESGEGYLYPADYLGPITIPAETRNKILLKSTRYISPLNAKAEPATFHPTPAGNIAHMCNPA